MKKGKNKSNTILIATGSSGGHLFPALATAHRIQDTTDCQIRFILAPNPNWKVPRELEDFKIYRVKAFPLPSGISPRMILFTLRFIVNSFRIMFILLKEKPVLVMGFGSFLSFPAVCLAKAMRIPTIIHEQNAVFGKANKMLKGIADRVALSFPETELVNQKTVVTGNPLRNSLAKSAHDFLYFPPKKADKINILVLGGSQGSHFLNQIVAEAWKGLSAEEMTKFSIKHIAGTRHLEEVSSCYKSLPRELEYEILPFSDEMEKLYQWSHWVIARAGAGTIFELMAFGIPSLLIPYPYAGSHQLENAKFLESRGACEVVEEKDLTSEALTGLTGRLLKRPEILKSMSDNAKKNSILDSAGRLKNLFNEVLDNSQ